MPLLRDGRAIGCIVLTAAAAGGFTDSQVALLRAFAEQAGGDEEKLGHGRDPLDVEEKVAAGSQFDKPVLSVEVIRD